MSTLPITGQQCFFVAVIIFVALGFTRGWKREVISLLFILLGVALINPNNNQSLLQYIQRIPDLISYLFTGRFAATPAPTSSTGSSPLITLLVFGLVVLLGYYVGNKAFPKPATPAERFIGIVPALISAAAVLYYLENGGFFAKTSNGASVATVFAIPDPSQYVPLIVVIAVIALIIALISSRAKKSAPPAKK